MNAFSQNFTSVHFLYGIQLIKVDSNASFHYN